MAPEQRQFPVKALGSLCALMPRPQLVTGLLVQWMRVHFKDAPNIDDPALRDSLWSVDIKKSGIVIDSATRFNPKQTEMRPGIFIKRGPWKIIRMGIDDRMMNNKIPSGFDRYNNFTQGSHVLFCVSRQPAEAEILACEVFRELMMFGPIARKYFKFLRFVVTEVGELGLLEEATEHFVVPITVGYGAQDYWEISENAPQLKSFKLSTFVS